jgi:hypothetical protein
VAVPAEDICHLQYRAHAPFALVGVLSDQI